MSDTNEPMGWAVVLSDGQPYERCDFLWEAQAIADALPANEGVSATVVPLYPQPTLTDAEREAVAGAADLLIGSKPGATLRNLLERLTHDVAPEARAAEPESSVPLGSVAAPANTHTLTAEEREAIEWCVEMATVHAMECDDELVTLRRLLERLA